MLELKDVTLTFPHGEGPLLRNVSFSAEPGEWIGLTGPSGGGKTLIGLIASGVIPGLIRAEVGGTARLSPDGEGMHTPASIVFQDPSFQLLATTVRDELLYTPRKLAWPEDSVRRDYDRIVEGLDLGHLIDRNPRELSLGEIQRVAVGVALIQRPRILVLDEPTQYHDRFHVNRTLEFAASLTREYGTAVLLIEHHIRLLKRFCDRTYRVEDGVTHPAEPVEPELPQNDYPVQRTGGACCELTGVDFHYKPGRSVLRGLSLAVSRGESVALIGPNGSGKSTLAKIMCGLASPVSGSVTLFGKPRTNGSWFRHIGYVMQNPDRQIFASTVREECAFGPRNFDVPEDIYTSGINRLLDDFGLGGFGERDPLTLSYGEKRRMNISGVLSYDPSVLILDEPTSGLDYENRRLLAERLKKLSADGMTIVVITHDLAFARAVCRRAVFLSEGRIVRDTSLTDIREDDVVSLYAS